MRERMVQLLPKCSTAEPKVAYQKMLQATQRSAK